MDIRNNYDYSLLRECIKEKYKSETLFANDLGISSVSLSGRLNNKLYWAQPEMIKTGELLGINSEDLHQYFFKRKLKNT